MSPPLFALERVTLDLGGRRILDDVSAELPDDGITCLVGPSGSGKSTLLRLLNRLEVPTSGVVRYRGHDVASLDPLQHRRQVGMVFQRPTPFPGTVRDNLLVARPGAADDLLRATLERAALPASFLDRVADDLSGGEAQRMCVARTLVTEPDVVLMDEPTSALDPAATAELEALARQLADDGVRIVWVSHDPEQVARIADHRFVVDAGRLRRG